MTNFVPEIIPYRIFSTFDDSRDCLFNQYWSHIFVNINTSKCSQIHLKSFHYNTISISTINLKTSFWYFLLFNAIYCGNKILRKTSTVAGILLDSHTNCILSYMASQEWEWNSSILIRGFPFDETSHITAWTSLQVHSIGYNMRSTVQMLWLRNNMSKEKKR